MNMDQIEKLVKYWFLICAILLPLFFILLLSSCANSSMDSVLKINKSLRDIKHEIKRDRTSDID